MLKPNPGHGLSTLRLWVMRVPYFFTGVLFTLTAWTTLVSYWGTFEAVEGVAYAFWGALSLLALIGLRFPVRMLPLLLLQFGYKLVWLLAVGFPLMAQNGMDAVDRELFQANLTGVVIDTIAIPWLYTIRTYGLAIFSRAPDP